MVKFWFCRKFSFEAICGMLSRGEQRFIMREGRVPLHCG
jgi:hypothetical protein